MADGLSRLSAAPVQLSRKCTSCAEEEHEGVLQRKPATSSHPPNADAPASVQSALATPGRGLDAGTRAFFEPRFGCDLGNVRIHTDGESARSAAVVDSKAYAVGRDIVFAAGRYVPSTIAGARLLAHELAHVVQQASAEHSATSTLRRQTDEIPDAGPTDASLPGGVSSPIPETREPDSASAGTTSTSTTKICSKRLDAFPGAFGVNHSYIDDTGMGNCRGKDMPGNYAIQTLVSGNFVKGCAAKTSTSTDPQTYTPNVKRCDPAPGVTDVSKCLRAAYAAYPDPSLYQNPFGPNSNTFAKTLATACCADGSSSGLGTVPGWDHDPAPPCPTTPRLAGGGAPGAGAATASVPGDGSTSQDA